MIVARVQAVMLMFAGVLGGMPNAPAAHRLLAAPEVSVASGFCEGPFSLSFRPPTSGGNIRYTLDGSEPSWTNGLDYSGPLRIAKNTLLRGAVFKAQTRVSRRKP